MTMTNTKSHLLKPGAAFLLLLPALVTLSACYHSGHRAERPDRDEMMAMCPMTVPGTQVYPADTANGESLTFTTTVSDQVPELRMRVHAMANMHNQHHGGMGGGHRMGGMMMSPPSRSWVEDVDGGARISMTPNDADDLQKLQSAVRMHAAHLQQNGCRMEHE